MIGEKDRAAEAVVESLAIVPKNVVEHVRLKTVEHDVNHVLRARQVEHRVRWSAPFRVRAGIVVQRRSHKDDRLQRQQCRAGERRDRRDMPCCRNRQERHENPQRHLVRIPPRLDRPVDFPAIEHAIVRDQKIALNPQSKANAEEQGYVVPG